MDKLRIGVVGCGGMARSHASRFSRILDQIEVAALCDVIPERAQAVADLLPGTPLVTSDYHDLFDRVDAVLLVLPHHLHHRVTVDFLNAGKHVLVEKPMANSEEECLDMIEAARRNRRALMVAYCMRFHPLVVKMKELLDAKEYGECFHLSIWTEQLTRYPPEHWASSAKTLGGGQLFSHGCHYIDLMLWMLGRPVRGCHFGTNTGTPWMEREGTSDVVIEFEGGVLGYHMGTWGARGTRHGYNFQAHCTGGMIEADITGGKLIVHNRQALHDPNNPKAVQNQEVLMEIQHAKPTEVEMAHFVECIRERKKPLTDPVESLEGLRVIWKLYEAEESGALSGGLIATAKSAVPGPYRPW